MILRDKRVLVTQNEDDSGKLFNILKQNEADIMHCPLERFVSIEESDIQKTLNEIEQYDNIIYGNLKNAGYFFEHIFDEHVLEKVLNRINFALDRQTADYLEDRGVPAITAAPNTKPIALVELMLRLGQMGKSLYPCGRHFKEELPGLLFELSIECKELELYDKVGPSDQDLKRYRVEVTEKQPDFVVFHSADSVRRTQIAFPDLNWEEIDTIVFDKSISHNMEKNGLAVDHVISLEEAKIK